MLPVLLSKFESLVDLDAAEPTRSFENDWVEPKLGDLLLALHMNVRRSASIQRHEEKPVSSDSQHSGHSVAILSHRCETTLWGVCSSGCPASSRITLLGRFGTSCRRD